MRIGDWSSDVCSSDLQTEQAAGDTDGRRAGTSRPLHRPHQVDVVELLPPGDVPGTLAPAAQAGDDHVAEIQRVERLPHVASGAGDREHRHPLHEAGEPAEVRSEEHTSELQSLMRISYAVFSLKKKTLTTHMNDE